MNLKTVTIADLKDHPDNPNTHPAKQIEALKESVDEFDQVKNIVIWRGFILAGHAFRAAAIQAGRLTLEAQDVSDWPKEKAMAFMLTDIRLPDMAFVDDEAMAEALRAIDEPLEIPGFDDSYLGEVYEAADSMDALDQMLDGKSVPTDRNMGDPKKQIKPVLYVDEVSVFEDAIKSTGIKNRGQAIMEICKKYLEYKKGQFDFQTENVIAEEGFELSI